MTERTPGGRICLSDLAVEAFVSPLDRKALENLQRLPVLPLLIRKFNELALDQVWYTMNSSTSVRCGPRQFGTLYGLMREACSILHVPEPELYVRYDYRINAATAGVGRPFIVVNSALLDSFTDEELLFILGHEIGHMKCGHVLYLMLAMVIVVLLDTVGRSTLGLGQLATVGVLTAFYEWMRNAEFSCDRAGLLVCQDPRVAFSATMKLGGGSSRFAHEMNPEAFLEQARAHAEGSGSDSFVKALLFMAQGWQLSHPLVVYRAKGLDDWINSGDYARILEGDYPRDTFGRHQMGRQMHCPICATTVSVTVSTCPRCGKDLRAHAGTPSQCAACNADLPPGVRYCLACGTPAESKSAEDLEDATPDGGIEGEEEEPV